MTILLRDLYKGLGFEDWEFARDSGIELERFRDIDAVKANATMDVRARLAALLCYGRYENLSYMHNQVR